MKLGLARKTCAGLFQNPVTHIDKIARKFLYFLQKAQSTSFLPIFTVLLRG